MRQERKWTDDELRAAVAASKSYRAVLRVLGLKDGSLGYLQRCIAEHGLDTSHFVCATATYKCSNDQLRTIVASSTTLTAVIEAVGLEKHSANFHRLRKRIAVLGIDTSHFIREVRGRNRRTTRWTEEQLRAAVVASFSVAQTIRALGLVPRGGNYIHVQRRIRELGLDTSHFTGKRWNHSGKFLPSPPASLDEVLVLGRWTGSHRLKKRLFRAGLKEARCELCGWAERAPDGRIPVELDHVNGERDDNRLENLRILCPNCHSLQPTHRGLNQRRRKNNEGASGGT